MISFITDQNVPKIMIFEVWVVFVGAKKSVLSVFVYFSCHQILPKKRWWKCAEEIWLKLNVNVNSNCVYIFEIKILALAAGLVFCRAAEDITEKYEIITTGGLQHNDPHPASPRGVVLFSHGLITIENIPLTRVNMMKCSP